MQIQNTKLLLHLNINHHWLSFTSCPYYLDAAWRRDRRTSVGSATEGKHGESDWKCFWCTKVWSRINWLVRCFRSPCNVGSLTLRRMTTQFQSGDMGTLYGSCIIQPFISFVIWPKKVAHGVMSAVVIAVDTYCLSFSFRFWRFSFVSWVVDSSFLLFYSVVCE